MEIYESSLLRGMTEQFFAHLVSMASDMPDLINLGQGNPDTPTPHAVVSALKVAVDNPETHRYAPFRGLDSLKVAIAQRYREDFGVDLDPYSEVAVLPGGKAALWELPLCILDPGDKCLVTDPGYPDYLSGISLARAIPEVILAAERDQYLPDFWSLDVKKLGRIKMGFLNYPHNPTGVCAPADYLHEVVRLFGHNGWALVSDLSYGQLVFDGRKPLSLLQIEGFRDVGVEIYTMSKTYSMAGWRIAFLLGNRNLVGMVNRLQDHLHTGVFMPVQLAAMEALTGNQSSADYRRRIYERRRDLIHGKLVESGLQSTKPQGGIFYWMPVPNEMSSLEFCRVVLERCHVLVAPGSAFGIGGEGFVRLGLVDDEQRLGQALDRIINLNLW